MGMALTRRQTATVLPRFLATATIRMSSSAGGGAREMRMRKVLEHKFNPTHLELLNESSGHNVPAGSETHFKVLVVSQSFDSVRLVDRHRMVNDALSEELSQGLHALSIVAKTEEQWRKMLEDGRAAVEGSPQCRGGFGK